MKPYFALGQMLCLAGLALPVLASEIGPLGWTPHAPREEIRPEFAWEATGGPQSTETLIIRAGDRTGLAGHWEQTLAVTGGLYYRFSVERQLTNIDVPRRAAIARIIWLTASGQHATHAEPSFASYRPGERPRAEPEFPKLVVSGGAWERMEGVYLVPPDATQARIELHFRWGPPDSEVRWSLPQLEAVESPTPRKVRLATIHLRPEAGTTPIEKCEQFAPLIAQAAEQRADLVVLPETLTFYRSGGTYVDAAETIPGPSSNYFAALAKQHGLYIVAGLLERDGHLVYNVAVLLGPDGELVGKYRKVTLPRGEIEGGLMPGDEYPVFETRFGKVGMMICYDGFFPEVARELSLRGAEVIAWPVWGCNPLLAAARACENHVVIVSSTYTDVDSQWMQSAIYNRDGQTLAQAKKWGTMAIAELDLGKPLHWQSLGDFQAQIEPHRPVVHRP
jgi:predicted amidohydrolase